MKNKTNKCFCITLVLLFSWGFFTFGQKNKVPPKEKEIIKALPVKYQQWLALVTHIMAVEERQAFLQLKNDRERDMYMDLFWKQRDPTPATEENEFKNAHIERFQYANKYFKYGAGRPGWMTDMGRIYIILGKPDSIERFDMDNVVVPCQLWSYYGKVFPNLPSHFYILFFKRSGVGEFKMYDPLADGISALLQRKTEVVNTRATDNESFYDMINEEHPILAMAALSLIPDDVPNDFRPTIQSQILLTNIIELPQKQINTSYATNFLKYQGVVKVDSATDYIDADCDVYVLKDPFTGLHFIHLAIMPQRVSVDYNEDKDQYFFHFDLTISLKQKDKIIFNYQKKYPFYIKDEQELKEKFSNSLIITDLFPAPEGSYTLSVLIQNTVKKEISYVDKTVTIPAATLDKPTVMRPIVSYDVKRLNRMIFAPFKLADIEIALKPKKEFGTEDEVTIVAGIDLGKNPPDIKGTITIRNLFDEKKFNKSTEFDLPKNQRIFYLVHQANKLPPGNYVVQVNIYSTNKILLATNENDFIVNLEKKTIRPTQVAKVIPSDKLYTFYHILGHEYKNLNLLDQSLLFLEKAYQINPEDSKLLNDFSQELLIKGDSQRVLQIIEPLKDNNETLFTYYSLKGSALFKLGDYPPAIENLEKANGIYDSDIQVLNILGHAYLKTKNIDQAKKVFTASLTIFKNQPEIEKILNQL